MTKLEYQRMAEDSGRYFDKRHNASPLAAGTMWILGDVPHVSAEGAFWVIGGIEVSVSAGDYR